MSMFGQILKNLLGQGEGIEGCIRAAKSGDAGAQYTLGCFYERGQKGLVQNHYTAVEWYRRAAEQGHAGAQLYLGICLAQGKGVDPDFSEAYKWIELAKRGNALDRAAANETQSRLAKLMSAEEIEEGQRLARGFVTKRAGW